MGWNTISNTEHKCRKTKLCIWCGQPIEFGSKYAVCVGTMDGEFQRNSYHLECREAMHTCARDWGGSLEFTPYDHPRGQAHG